MSIAVETIAAASPAGSVGRPDKIRLGVIVGPTATGKSALALDLAERLGAEIVNADSRLFYRGMNIGVAKPSAQELRRVPHHLIDVRAPDRPLDVAGFREMASGAIAEIASRQRPVIVVGGSGLYLRVLRGGIFRGPPASPAIRAELEALAARHGIAYLHAQLGAADPKTASRVSAADLPRIVRALEVLRLTGQPISVHQQRHGFAFDEYRVRTVGLDLPRERLYTAIERRFDAMVQAGIIDEVRALVDAGFDFASPPLRAIGYRHIAAHLRGELSLDQAIALAKRDTRRLAKRQLTWFRRDPEIAWLDAERDREQALALFSEFFAEGRHSGG